MVHILPSVGHNISCGEYAGRLWMISKGMINLKGPGYQARYVAASVSHTGLHFKGIVYHEYH